MVVSEGRDVLQLAFPESMHTSTEKRRRSTSMRRAGEVLLVLPPASSSLGRQAVFDSASPAPCHSWHPFKKQVDPSPPGAGRRVSTRKDVQFSEERGWDTGT